MTDLVSAEIVPLATKDTGGLEIVSELIVRYRIMTYRIGGKEFRRVDQLGDPVNVVSSRSATGERISGGRGRKWSDAEEEQICADYKRAPSLVRIGQKWGGSTTGIMGVLQRHGIPRRPAYAPTKAKRNGEDRPVPMAKTLAELNEP